jgi:cytochrome c-type biogenesis protein CcmH
MTMDRRRFLGGLVASVVPVAGLAQDEAQTDSTVGQLWDPNRAGRFITPRGERDNAEEIKAIERRLRCTCGCNLDVYTCRTTDFTCGVSPEMHREVLGLWEGGQTAEEIIAAFVAQHGEAVLMAPPKEGFNLVGYAMPFAAVTAGFAALLLFLRHHARRSTLIAAAAPTSSVDATDDELARLADELQSDEP